MMSFSQNWKTVALVAVCILIFVLLILMSPKRINWSQSYTKEDTIPFGCYILYRQLPSLFPRQNINSLAWDQMDAVAGDTLKRSNLLFINDQFMPDQFEIHRLLKRIENGNIVFISASRFCSLLLDTFQLKLNYSLSFTDSIHSHLFHPRLRTTLSNRFYSRLPYPTFSQFDTLHTVVLGGANSNQVDYIRINTGKGALFLHTNPACFANINLLNLYNRKYVSHLLSCLPVQPVYWDETHKSGRKMIRTPLRYVLTHDSLKLAYLLICLMIGLTIIFRGKRTQRMIPVIRPPVNTSLEFVETVGRLYYKHRDHSHIIRKKIEHFYEYIRHYYHIDYHLPDENLISQLAEKTCVPLVEIEKLVDQLKRLSSKSRFTEDAFISLYLNIEQFYDSRKE